MSHENFEKTDESLMNDLKGLREKKVPPIYLKGFRETIESKIRERAKHKFHAPRIVTPFLVPAFAVLIFAVFVFSRPQFRAFFLPQLSPTQITVAKDLAIEEEIDVLRELGAWSDEDEGVELELLA